MDQSLLSTTHSDRNCLAPQPVRWRESIGADCRYANERRFQIGALFKILFSNDFHFNSSLDFSWLCPVGAVRCCAINLKSVSCNSRYTSLCVCVFIGFKSNGGDAALGLSTRMTCGATVIHDFSFVRVIFLGVPCAQKDSQRTFSYPPRDGVEAEN